MMKDERWGPQVDTYLHVWSWWWWRVQSDDEDNIACHGETIEDHIIIITSRVNWAPERDTFTAQQSWYSLNRCFEDNLLVLL